MITLHGFAFRVLTRDHDPPHVHAVGNDGVVLVNIDTATVRRVDGNVKQPDVARVLSVVAEHRGLLRAAWERVKNKEGW